MKVISLTVGQMSSNCFLVYAKNGDCVAIDPGDDADYIIQKILDFDLTPRAIIATHGHFDHILGVLELKLAYNIPFYMHPDDSFLLTRIRETAKHFLGTDPGPAPEVDLPLINGANIRAGDLVLEVIHTPGHTPGSVCLYARPHLFVGDLVFNDGSVGRTDHAYSNKINLSRSLKNITKFSGSTIIHPGHGESFVLSELSDTKEASDW